MPHRSTTRVVGRFSSATVAVGNALAGVPPLRSVRAELPHTAPTSGHGGGTANRDTAHDDERAARRSGSESGTRPPASCSPWSTAFPPPPPQATRARLCSAASQVLRGRPTSPRRARRRYGRWPFPADPSRLARWVPAGSPVSRVESFHACTGSSTARGPRAACRCRRLRYGLLRRLTASAPRST